MRWMANGGASLSLSIQQSRESQSSCFFGHRSFSPAQKDNSSAQEPPSGSMSVFRPPLLTWALRKVGRLAGVVRTCPLMLSARPIVTQRRTAKRRKTLSRGPNRELLRARWVSRRRRSFTVRSSVGWVSRAEKSLTPPSGISANTGGSTPAEVVILKRLISPAPTQRDSTRTTKPR
jgi:hypothetical protein